MAKKLTAGAITQAEKMLTQLDLKGLKRECIVRGMDFELVSEFDIPRLQSWFLENYTEETDPDLLVKYDEFLDKEFEKHGYDKNTDSWAYHASLRMSRAEDSTIEEPKKKKTRLLEKPKKKKPEKVEGFKSLRGGTKKAVTFTLTREGYNLTTITKKVISKFPDANEGSISIWHKKCLKEIGNKTNHKAALKQFVTRLRDKKGYSLKKITGKALESFTNVTKEEVKTCYNE